MSSFFSCDISGKAGDGPFFGSFLLEADEHENPNDIVEKILNRNLEANTEVKTLTQKISFDHFCLNKRIFPVLRSDDDHLWGQVIAPF
jgi:hypothetical protein